MNRNILFLFAIVLVWACDQNKQAPSVDADGKEARLILHPLDALSEAEILKVKSILADAGSLTKEDRVVDISLKEPPKDEVYVWKAGEPIPRSAQAALWKEGEILEIEIDIDKERIIDQKVVSGAKPSFAVEDILMAMDLWKTDQRITKELERRGYADLESIMGAPFSVGYFGDKQDRRLMNSTLSGPNGSIEGIMATIDLDAKEIIDVYINADVGRNDTDITWDKNLPDEKNRLKPVRQSSPEGNNYRFENGLISWDKWKFHVRVDRRCGPILSLVSFDAMSVAYQISPNEMFVPYMDPADDWAFRTFMDIGEYGFGMLSASIEKGSDVPENATLFDAVLATADGSPIQMKDVVAIFERNTGNPLWRHSEADKLESVPAIELVVRMIPVIGPYDYLVDYVFKSNGSMEIKIGASGIVTTKAVKASKMSDPTAIYETQTGTLIAPNLSGIFHDHFISLRMDMDIDGINNSFVTDEVVPVQFKNNKRKSAWQLVEHPELTEGAISEDDVEHDGYWRVVNKNKKNKLGQFKGYQILGHDVTSVMDVVDFPQRRAAWTGAPLWLTPFDEDEYYPSGKYPSQSDGSDGISSWIAQERSIDNTDIVCWYTIGFHHLTIPEDWPIMPTLWHTLTLRPYQSFDKSPAM